VAARAVPRAPTLASGANIGAFNVGNALGAWAGGVGISMGLGYTAPVWIGAAISGAGLVVMIAAALAARRARSVAPAPRPVGAATTSTVPVIVV